MAKPVVCVVGAGTAGLEGLLAAREQLGSEAEFRLIAPEREFRYRPISSGSLFRPAPERGLAIADIVADLGASWVRDRAEVIRPGEHTVLTRDGDEIDFDFLLLAAGARSRRALRQGYLWERGADPGFLDQILTELHRGEVGSVAVVIPRGARWPVPAYELALVLAWSGSASGAAITLLTAEQRPLGVLGSAATDTVMSELKAAGVEVKAGVEMIDAQERTAATVKAAEVVLVPESPAAEANALTGRPTDPARVRVGNADASEFERLISLPTVVGPAITGVATDAVGFIEVDTDLRVRGADRIWAAGSCVAAALEHSALSAQQADAAVAAIGAAVHGDSEPVSPAAPLLTGYLLTGQRGPWLAENPAGTHQPSTRCLWWPPGRAVGRMLAKRIAAWDPATAVKLPALTAGTVVSVPVALPRDRSAPTAAAELTDDVRDARLRDLEQRQLMAVARHEREAAAEIGAMERELHTFAKHEQAVASMLRDQGYLREGGGRATSS